MSLKLAEIKYAIPYKLFHLLIFIGSFTLLNQQECTKNYYLVKRKDLRPIVWETLIDETPIPRQQMVRIIDVMDTLRLSKDVVSIKILILNN